MPETLINPFRGPGLPGAGTLPRDDASGVARLLTLCPVHAETPLTALPDLARALNIAQLWVKEERARMGLGSFKALGAAHAIACAAAQAVQNDNWTQALTGQTFITASAGNHGLSLAAGARLFGAQAII